MSNSFGNFVHSVVDWAIASDRRYREACKMMQLDEHDLEDVGLTRDELLDELGISRPHGIDVGWALPRELAGANAIRGEL